MDLPTHASMAVSLAYEVFERKRWGSRLFKVSHPETFPNALVDIAIFYLGHRPGRRWNRTGYLVRISLGLTPRRTPAAARSGPTAVARRQLITIDTLHLGGATSVEH